MLRVASVFQIKDSSTSGPLWLRRLFLALAALWLVAQAHLGSFIGGWDDDGRLPGNICALLILYCLARLLLDWGLSSLRLRRLSGDALFFIVAAIGLDLAWRALAGPSGLAAGTGLVSFLMQPVLVLMGLAVLHRQQLKPH